jgi:hypothetical protein
MRLCHRLHRRDDSDSARSVCEAGKVAVDEQIYWYEESGRRAERVFRRLGLLPTTGVGMVVVFVLIGGF